MKTHFSQQIIIIIIQLPNLLLNKKTCLRYRYPEASISGPTFSYVTKNHCIILLLFLSTSMCNQMVTSEIRE